MRFLPGAQLQDGARPSRPSPNSTVPQRKAPSVSPAATFKKLVRAARIALPWITSVLILGLLIPTFQSTREQTAEIVETNRSRAVSAYDAVVQSATSYAAVVATTGAGSSQATTAMGKFEGEFFTALMYASSSPSDSNLRVFNALNNLRAAVHRNAALQSPELSGALIDLVAATCEAHNDPGACHQEQWSSVDASR